MAQAAGDVIFTAAVLALLVYCYLPGRGGRLFRCPRCGMRFDRAPRSIGLHFFDFVWLRCPYCGVLAWMRRQR